MKIIKIMEKSERYIAFVFSHEIDDKDFSQQEARTTLNCNVIDILEFKIKFEEKEFYEKDLIEILEIINNNMDSYIGIYEQEVLYEQDIDIKKKCLNDFNKLKNNKIKNKFLDNFITLFELSINNNKNLYMLF